MLVAYYDPTPISDTLNAGLNAADGNYADAAMSLAGALIPGGGDKAAKGAARVGGNIMEGMGDAARRANKAIDCNSSNRALSTMGGMLGRCFTAGHWIVVLDEDQFAKSPAIAKGNAAEGTGVAGTGYLLLEDGYALIAGSVVLVAAGLAIQESDYRRRKQRFEADLLDACFAEWDTDGVVDEFDDEMIGSAASEGRVWDEALLEETSDPTWSDSNESDRLTMTIAPPATVSHRNPKSVDRSTTAMPATVSPARRVRITQQQGTHKPPVPKRNRAWLAGAGTLALFLLAFALPWNGGWSGSSPLSSTESVNLVAAGETQDTLVGAEELPRTEKLIEDIQPGDIVLAMNVETGELEPREVLQKFVRTSPDLRLLDFETETGDLQRFETTDEHPFWLPDRQEFVEAADLSIGDTVLGPAGERQHLVASTLEAHPEGVTVYNFEVEEQHNYFVTGPTRVGPPVLVHNAADNYGKLPKRARIQNDHQPSSKALKLAAEKVKGSKLTTSEARRVHQRGPAVTVSTSTHRAKSPTYGGRQHKKGKGGKTRAQRDSEMLNAARRRDSTATGVNAADQKTLTEKLREVKQWIKNGGFLDGVN